MEKTLTIAELYDAALGVAADVEKNFDLHFGFYLDEYNHLTVNLWDKAFNYIFRGEVSSVTEHIYEGFILVEKVGGIAYGYHKALKEAEEAAKPEVDFGPLEEVKPQPASVEA